MRYRPTWVLTALARFVCRAVLRAVVTGLILTTCLMVALAYMGVRLPDLNEMLDRFESVSRLADILS
ncbi:MAG TPA: hypothetical protein VNZ44_05815 [Pyrinomonadaceae bacterium]|nr:hypothetical protein [Pyrinomonadaceae bacterium]